MDYNLTSEQIVSLITMVLNDANVRCYHVAFLGKAEQKICRGARNFQLHIFHVLGVLDHPTDIRWADTLSKVREQGSCAYH